MKIITVAILCAVVSLAVAAPTPEDAQVQILSYQNTNDGLGNYDFSYETSNGILCKESGKLVNVDQPDQYMEVYGSFSYIDQDGVFVVIDYKADQDGYHILKPRPPTGASGGISQIDLLASLIG